MRGFQILNDAIKADVFPNKSLPKSATQKARSHSHPAILAYGDNQTVKQRQSFLQTNKSFK